MSVEILHQWDRQPKEPALWYDRFTQFCQMGSGRALLEIVNRDRDRKGTRRRTSIPGAWTRASDRWQWRSRAEAYDQEQRRLDAETLASARDELRQVERALAARLRERAQTMLDWPLAETLTADGLTVLKPARWSKADVARYLELSDKLDRLALGMETTKTDVTTGGKPIASLVDYTSLTDDELREILSRRSSSRTGEPNPGPPKPA